MAITLAALATLLLLGPIQSLSPPQEQSIDHAVDASREAFDLALNDYPSARFGDVHGQADPSGKVKPQLCGMVNAKNLAGAYTGWVRFAVTGGNEVFREGDSMGNIMVATICDQSPDMVRSQRDVSADLAHRP